MENSLFIPQPGFRFYFKAHPDYIFEIGSITYNAIRYAAIAGGKSFSITPNEFESRYKLGEILCVFAPEKLIINPKYSLELHRKERYVVNALQLLEHPTSINLLSELIPQIASDINDLNPPSCRTVARWINKYKSSSQNKLCLQNKYSGNRSLRFSPEIYQILNQAINEVYLKPEYRSGKDVQAYMLGRFIEQGIPLEQLPTLRSIQRHIKKLDPYIEFKMKKGSRIAKKKFQAAGKSIISRFALYMVEIDTHYLDLIVIDPKTKLALGRPFLACAIDIYSRAIVGTYINMYPPSAATTLEVIKDMITRPNQKLPGGIPSIVIPDNGVEFKNNALERVCEQLKITLTPSQVGTPNNKPHIERFFSTLTHGIIQKLPGTTFSNPTNRGEYNSSKIAQLTLEQLKQYIDTWIHQVYHRSIHHTTGRSPIIMWQDAIEDIRPSFLTDIDAKILCRRPIERSINHGQVRVDVERFLIGAYPQPKSVLVTSIEAPADNDNIQLKDVAKVLDINYETARKLAKTGWFNLENTSEKPLTLKKYSKEKVNRFKDKYILVSQLATQLEVSPTNLVEKLGALGIAPTNGPHIDSTAINIFLKTDVQDIKPDNLSMIKGYPTRSGRHKNALKVNSHRFCRHLLVR